MRAEPHDAFRAAAMRLDAALLSALVGEPRETVRLAELAWPVAERGKAPLRLFALLVLAVGRIYCGNAIQGAPLLEAALPLLRSTDLSMANPASQVALMKLCLGEHRDAHEILVGVVARLRAEGALSLLPWVLGAAALASFVIGDWRGAEALALESLALAEDVGQRALVTQPAVVLALVANAQGRTVDARTYLRQAETVMEAFGVEAMKTMGGWARGRIELEDGDYEAAVIALDATGRFSLERGLEEPAVALWAQDLAEAHARLGRPHEAEATLEVLEAQAERTGRRIAHAGVARCRGLLADETEFEPHFERAMRWHDGVEYPFERARTQLYLGERLRRANRRIDARGPLHDALSIFNTLGAHRWIERATRELRATGERARRRIPEAVDQLTPQEMLVARLAADGATNREAAAALFVSPKTIDTHLGHIYRKLAVRSRVELARRLGDTSRKSQANT